ncbi:MAG: HEAT repeat domain-containing protein [Pseudomonadota bacterium]
MKKFLLLLGLLALASLVSMNWMSLSSSTDGSAPLVATHEPNDQAQVATQAAHTLSQFTRLWGDAGSASASAENADTFDLLWALALSPATQLEGKDDVQDRLRKLAQENPHYLKKLVALYDSDNSAASRELIINLLASIPSAETLALSRRLASSPDAGQRKAALSMLGNLNINLQVEHELILLSLNNQQTPAVALQALAALKAPAPAGIDAPGKPANNSIPDNADTKTTAAVIRQLQSLTENPDATVRSRSISQLAQWDKNDSSLSYFSAALNDQIPEVRQAAIFAIAQSGANVETAKQLLNGVINNANENALIKASARQVLEVVRESKEKTPHA